MDSSWDFFHIIVTFDIAWKNVKSFTFTYEILAGDLEFFTKYVFLPIFLLF